MLSEVKHHKKKLIQHRMLCRRVVETGTAASSSSPVEGHPGSEPDYEELDDVLDAAMQALEVVDESTPVRVIGMRAEWGLASAVVSLVVSSFFLALIQAWLR